MALIKLLKKVPLFVKPFLPQLQRTFAKGLADTSSEPLRQRSAQGLSVLITLAPRIDPLVAGKSFLILSLRSCHSSNADFTRIGVIVQDLG